MAARRYQYLDEDSPDPVETNPPDGGPESNPPDGGPSLPASPPATPTSPSPSAAAPGPPGPAQSGWNMSQLMWLAGVSISISGFTIG